MKVHDDTFFIGWSGRAPAGLGRFLAVVGAGLLLGLALSAVALGSRTNDPAGPDFTPGPAMLFGGEESFVGRLTLSPYPLLHLAPDAAHPRGRTLLLSGDGKRGAPVEMAGLDGATVEARGFLLHRGSMAMLALDETPPVRDDVQVARPVTEALGRWRVTGEICDGKCAAGGMRPGTGLSHKACAELCLAGEIPAVLVATAPIAGQTVLLLADAEGNRPPQALRGLAGVRLRLDGVVERRGDMLVFLADPATLRFP